MNSNWVLFEAGIWVDIYQSLDGSGKHKRVSRFLDNLDELNLDKAFFDSLSYAELEEISVDIALQAHRVFWRLSDEERRSVLLSILHRSPGPEASILAYVLPSIFSKSEALGILEGLLARDDMGVGKENIYDIIQSLKVNPTGQP